MGSSDEEQREELRTKRLLKNRNLELVFAVTFISASAIGAITPAFPAITSALDVSSSLVGLLVTIYTLPAIFLTPVLGVLADRLGRKKVLVTSLLVFGLAGGACAFAPSFPLLLMLRFVQGVGGGVLFSLGVTIIGDIYDGATRTKAVGYDLTAIGLGATIFPAVGGALALLGWNYPFALAFLAVPIGLLAMRVMDTPEPENQEGLKDYLAGVLNVIKHRQVIGLFIISILYYIVLLGAFFTYLPIFLEEAFGASALLVGFLLSARALSFSITSAFLGKVTHRVSPQRLIKLAAGFIAVVLIAIPFVQQPWWVFLPAVLYGLAAGVLTPSMQTLLANSAPARHRAAFLSFETTVRRTGQSLGPVLMGVIYSSLGVSSVFYAGALLSLVILGVALLMLRS